MTPGDYDKLSDNEKRIKVAEHAGCECRQEEMSGNTIRVVWITPHGQRFMGEPPDYLNDLNAMHKAKDALRQPHTEDRWHRHRVFEEVLWQVMGAGTTCELLFATAAQQAKSFVLTMEES